MWRPPLQFPRRYVCFQACLGRVRALVLVLVDALLVSHIDDVFVLVRNVQPGDVARDLFLYRSRVAFHASRSVGGVRRMYRIIPRFGSVM